MPHKLKTLSQYAQRDKQYDKARGTAAERGYDKRWQRIRLMHLRHNPLCYDCNTKCQVTAANEVHHIIALADGGTHNTDNIMSLCKSCHSKRTVNGR